MVKLTKCVTQSAAEALIQGAANCHDNSRFRATIGVSDWSAILAKELYYHGSCYLEIVRPNREHGKNIPIDNKIKEEFLAEVEKRVLQDYEVMPSTELSEIYGNIAQNNNEHAPIRKTLVNLICKNFENRISCWTPRSGP